MKIQSYPEVGIHSYYKNSNGAGFMVTDSGVYILPSRFYVAQYRRTSSEIYYRMVHLNQITKHSKTVSFRDAKMLRAAYKAVVRHVKQKDGIHIRKPVCPDYEIPAKLLVPYKSTQDMLDAMYKELGDTLCLVFPDEIMEKIKQIH